MLQLNKSSDEASAVNSSKGKKALLIVAAVLFLIVAGGASTVLILQQRGKEMASFDDAEIIAAEDAVAEDDGKTVQYNGKTYRLNENIASVACLGVDKTSLGTVSNKIGTGGQADTNMVLAIDTASGKVTVIAIPRDTMVDVDVYTVVGEYTGCKNEQLCLAYAYGDGKHISCENAVRSIERVLFGMPVNSYVSIDMDGVAALNDAVGGVKVTSPETIDGFTAGKTITLYGKNALEFVKARGDDTNASSRRLERQKLYIKAFAQKAVSAAKKDFGTVTRLYNTASKYCCTNVGLSRVTYLASSLLSKGVNDLEIVSIPGEMKMGKKYSEFYIDTAATYELILDVYYTEVTE